MTWQEHMKSASWAFWRSQDFEAMELAVLAAVQAAVGSAAEKDLIEELTQLGLDVSAEADFQGRFECFPAAIALWQHTLAIADRTYGPEDERCLKFIEYLSHCLFRADRHNEALEVLRCRIKATTAKQGESAAVVVHMKKCLARLLYWLESHDEAIALLSSVVEKEEYLFGADSEIVACTRAELKEMTTGPASVETEPLANRVGEFGAGIRKEAGEDVFATEVNGEDVTRAVAGFLRSTRAAAATSLAEADKTDLIAMIVGLAGSQVNWRERFADTMKLHGITTEEIEDEIRKMTTGTTGDFLC